MARLIRLSEDLLASVDTTEESNGVVTLLWGEMMLHMVTAYPTPDGSGGVAAWSVEWCGDADQRFGPEAFAALGSAMVDLEQALLSGADVR